MILLTFPSTNQAMAAKKMLRDVEGLRFIPLPPEIDAGCGLALIGNRQAVDKARQRLDKEGLPYKEHQL